MTALDWKALGLKCGIEIHQQLEGKKLFCSCPTFIRDDPAHFTIQRQLRAVAGESGDVDVAAKHEMEKGKTFTYEGFTDTTCLVELDDTPPELLNQDALFASLQVVKLLNATPVDQIHVMRKTVVDGSNTSGFQRTALIARNGTIRTEHGTVTIPTISLEEDACRIIKNTPEQTLYRLDRLGIPLIEIGTGPDIVDPDHAKEVSEALGLLIRCTGRAKRGLGTIRQDVNVSIKGGTRIEIKGAQELKMIPTLVAYEALRQKTLLEMRDELKKRKASIGTPEDITHILEKSQSTVIKKALEQKGSIVAVKLTGFAGLVGKEVQPARRLGTELSDYGKARAGVKGLFHSDELPNYGITQSEVDAIKKALGCKEHDAFALIADTKEKANNAMHAVISRATHAIEGVPKEVRKANDDGTSTFLRPMSGAARLYPETDVPTIPLTDMFLEMIPTPELIDEKVKRYEAMGLGRDLALMVAKSEKTVEFETFVKHYPGIKPAYLAETYLTAERTIKRQHNIDIQPTEEDYKNLFKALNNEHISKESVIEILKENKPVADILHKYKSMSDQELLETLKDIAAKNQTLPYNALIGKAMAQLRGKASGEKIANLLKNIVNRG
ncbi:MAG: Glu-tRNA(Gln) amidotransferase subunit GatE [Nanoarchaeota archaeon]